MMMAEISDQKKLRFMANRLAKEKSLYLRQHADNPVDWYPWGEEALSKAKDENKPLLVSIGYSSCHWCHVMAHESFENDYIANLMNEHFVCIKVDREERPDVDQIYMEAVQMITNHGGWPLNVFCFPDGRPFFGGTYFPPDDRGQGLVPWPQLIMRVAEFYKNKNHELEENADNIIKNMAGSNIPGGDNDGHLDNQQLLTAAEIICNLHDDEWGGFGQAPKFPPSMALNFLLELRLSSACEEQRPSLARRIDEVIVRTLSAMVQGGVYDQVGGGFARYSVDRSWLIPHFEKMLYDNGLLLDIYTKGWMRYRQPIFKAVVEETVSWLTREMLAPNGGFYSSIDADSEGEEGKYYVWTPGEIESILGPNDSKQFCEAYSITESGNFEHQTSNPALSTTEFNIRQALLPMREKLLQKRSSRVPPAKDTKQLVAWNSLVIRGLAEAAFAFGRKDWLEYAVRAANWIWETQRFDDHRLHALYYEDSGPGVNAYLDDYAFYAEALLTIGSKIDWLESGASKIFMQRAIATTDIVFEHFSDPSGQHGFYFTSDDHEKLVSRKKEWWDNAIPAGNSSLIHVMASLYAITGENKYREELDTLRRAYSTFVEQIPNGIPHALAGLTSDAVGIAVIKVKGNQNLDLLQEKLANKPWRRVFLQFSDDPAQPEGYQLCVGSQCLKAEVDPAAIIEKL